MINVIYPNFHYPCDRLAFFKTAYHMFDAEFYVKADDDIYLRPGKVRGYVLQFLKSILWLLFILLRQIDLLLFLQKKDLSTGLTLVAWRKDQLSMIQIWNGQFKFWDMFLLNFIKIHLFTNEIVISNSGTYVALIHIHLFSCMQLLWNAEFAIAKLWPCLVWIRAAPAPSDTSLCITVDALFIKTVFLSPLTDTTGAAGVSFSGSYSSGSCVLPLALQCRSRSQREPGQRGPIYPWHVLIPSWPWSLWRPCSVIHGLQLFVYIWSPFVFCLLGCWLRTSMHQ